VTGADAGERSGGTTVAEPDQTALVAAARDGDKAAFAALVARHRPMLLALCASTLRDDDLAEDAAQEAVLLALTSLDRLLHADRFGSWLAGIGLNVCRRWRRERARDSWSWGAVQGGLVGDWPGGPDPAELAEAAEDARRVRAAVAALPPGQRAAVRLHYLDGLTQAQAAARVGSSVGAIRVQLHQARARLRQRLAPWWREERMTAEQPTGWVEMRVVDVRRGAATDDRPERNVVLLDEVGGARHLQIWVGPFEGTALAMAVREVELPRPLTFRFAAGMLAAAGGTLREVRVTRLVEGTFYAQAVVDGPKGEGLVDARPSDAINLALLVGAPVRVDPAVLDVAQASPIPWGELPDQLPADAAQIVSDRLTDWERSREAMARARQQGSR
jgi:RNA polymerase sigma factor (sigma-70 family)